MLSNLARFPFGPIFLILLIPYTSWRYFDGTFPLWQANRMAAICAVAVLGLMLVLRPVVGSFAKAGTLVTLPVAVLIYLGVDTTTTITVLAVLAIALVIDRKRAHENAALGLTIVGAVFLSGALEPVVQSLIEDRTPVSTEHAPLGKITLTQKPSIIHIVLDGYGAPDVLAGIYDHDLTPFISALEGRGFFVMPDVVTPYSQTLPTMASVLSADTVDLTNSRISTPTLRRDLGHAIGNSPVVDIFRQAGYTIAASESGYEMVNMARSREIAKSASWMTSFEANVIPTFLGSQIQIHGRQHNDRLRAVLSPGTLGDVPQPFFYYQHLLAPHPPFSINADGTDRPYTSIAYVDADTLVGRTGEGRAEYFEGYRQKAIFIENALVAQIDAFPEGPKIIIIHGDHGPGAFLNSQNADKTCLAERMQTFAAIYSNVPEVAALIEENAGRPFFLVNLYRLVLNGLSQTEIELLPERSRHVAWSDLSVQKTVTHDDLAAPCHG